MAQAKTKGDLRQAHILPKKSFHTIDTMNCSLKNFASKNALPPVSARKLRLLIPSTSKCLRGQRGTGNNTRMVFQCKREEMFSCPLIQNTIGNFNNIDEACFNDSIDLIMPMVACGNAEGTYLALIFQILHSMIP